MLHVESVAPPGARAVLVFATRILLPGILGELLAAKSEHGLDRGFQRILYDQQRRPKRPSSILLLPSSNARSFSCVRSDANILCIQELLRGGRSRNSRAASPERLACVMTKVDTVQQGLFRPESLRARELAWQGRPALATGNHLARARDQPARVRMVRNARISVIGGAGGTNPSQQGPPAPISTKLH
jgi:hypothetical protein